MNFGAIKYDTERRAWAISCAPHVAMRLKRVFAKIDAREFGTLYLADTTENARDLEWVLDRYPMRVEHGSLLAERAKEHRETQALVDDLLSQRRPPPTFELALPPRRYQAEAAALLLARGSLLLADDVGLGKTCSAIATLVDPRTRPALIVTLTHLPRQWQAEIERFAPSLRTHILKRGTPYNIARGDCARYHRWEPAPSAPGGARCRACGITRDDAYHGKSALPDVVITNYHKLAGWAETLAPLIKSVVFDEIQELRHPDSNRYAAAQHLARASAFRMGLSATPIYNYGGEIYNVLTILDESVGEREEFYREWCTTGPGQKQLIKEPKAFGEYARGEGLMLRRTRTDVGRELPPLTKVPHFIEHDAEALEKVSASCAELARLILRQSNSKEDNFEKMRASEELSWKLRQATGISKAPYVADFVRLLLEQGEKRVVLFGWHKEVYAIWEDKLRDLGIAFYTGAEDARAKERAKERFTSGEAKVLVISLRAGAGLDGLQHVCRTCVFGELDWSPSVHIQCAGRIDRDGQKEPVTAYFLIAEEGSDPVVCDVLQLKTSQAEGIRNPKGELAEELAVDPNHVKRLAQAYLEQLAGGGEGAAA